MARSSASSPNWMRRPWSENFATCPAPSPRPGTPSCGSIRPRVCGLLRCRPTDLRRPEFLGSGFRPRSASDVERYLAWAAVPDPLAEGARARALAPRTLHLRRTQIHSAVTRGGCGRDPVDQLTSLASLVEPETFRALLRHRWREDGSHALRLHPRRRRHAGRDRCGMGEGARGYHRHPQGPSQQARNAAVRLDRKEHEPCCASSMILACSRLWFSFRTGCGTRAARPGDVAAAVHRPADRPCDRPSAPRAAADGESSPP